MLQDGETLPAATEIGNIAKPQDADFVTLIKTDKNIWYKTKVFVKM